jgi:DNA-binding beta-propeller fold protein YncE
MKLKRFTRRRVPQRIASLTRLFIAAVSSARATDYAWSNNGLDNNWFNVNRRLKTPLQIIWPLLLMCATVAPGAVPGLVDTINPLPGPGCPSPWRVAVNKVTHRIYALSEGGGAQGQGALSIIDADTDLVVGGIATQWPIDGFAVNENTNRIYLSTSSGTDVNHLTPAAMVIDGANNQVIGTYQARLGSRFAVDPVTGRIFTLSSGVDVYDGTSLALLASMPPQNQGNNLAVNPTNRTL